MEKERFDRLVEIMAAIAGGDRAATASLYIEFGGPIAGFIRREAATFGVTLTADDLDGLVIDACLALGPLARSWDPAKGALPWTWARLRLRKLVSDQIGQHTDTFDADRHDTAANSDSESVQTASEDRDDLDALAALAGDGHPLASLLTEAFSECGIGLRNQSIVVGYQLQAEQGDPSPARTIGARHDLAPDAVRQVVARARRKLRTLAEIDARFAPLAAIPLVA